MRGVIEDASHRRLTAARLAEAELHGLNARLKDPELCAKQLKLLNGPGLDRLWARRLELLKNIRPTPSSAGFPRNEANGVLAALIELLWPWQRIAFSR